MSEDVRRPGTDPAQSAEPAERRLVLQQEASARLIRLATPFVSVFIAILVGSLFVLAAGRDPVEAFTAMFHGALGSQRAIGETLLRSTPLIFTGLAVAYGFRAGLFNIGAEGQLFMGGLAAAYFGVVLGGLPWVAAVSITIVMACLAGAAWAFLPGLMKARIGAHEVITTMMLSYIGRYIVSYLVTGPLRAEGAIPQTAQIAASARLPRLSDVFGFLMPTRAHLGIVLAILVAIGVWALLKYTVIGYEARAVGFNPMAAQTAGISVSRTIITSLCISGALAGLAGGVEVMGQHYRVFDQFSSGFGFTGIAVALLAKNNPIGVIPAAILFGALNAGAGTMQLEAGVSVRLVDIIQATVIFLIGAETIVTWMFSRVRERKGVAPVAG